MYFLKNICSRSAKLAAIAFAFFLPVLVFAQEKPQENAEGAGAGTGVRIAPQYISSQWETLRDNFKDFTWEETMYFFLGILGTLIVSKILSWLLEKHLVKLTAKSETKLDDIACKAIGKPAGLLVFSVGLYLSASPFFDKISATVAGIYGRICLALAAVSLAWAIYRLVSVIDYLLKKMAESTDNNLDDVVVAIIRKSLKITIFVGATLFIGQNILLLNITTLLAGAGVAGLAIAFAAQDTVANFFGSIMIILDQPFKAGERIKLSGYDGVVESVGFRSTRLRTLDGHQVYIPNKSAANDVVENIGRRPFIKWVSNITVTYDTSPEKMKRALEILHEILDNHEGMNEDFPPWIYFNSFNDWALNILVIAWYHPPEYKDYLEWCQKTNLRILERFNAEGIDFAFPSNTTYLAGDDARPVTFTQKIS